MPNFSFADEPARVKKVFYHLVDEYVPAYYVEADVYLPSASGNILVCQYRRICAGRKSLFICNSATDGHVLFPP